MQKGFDLKETEAAVRDLPSHRHRVAFGAGICSRLLPNYRAFSREAQWGNESPLRVALGAIWDFVAGRALTLGQVRDLQAQCRLLTPDPASFTSSLTSAAMDASNAVHETLEACRQDDPNRIAVVASLARDTVDMFVQERDGLDYADPRFERRVLQDPAMQRELAKQAAELLWLRQHVELTPAGLEEYRLKATYNGRSNLDVG